VSRPSARHGLRYAPGLDGVRALAVAAVVAYHVGVTSGAIVLPGGFLGVDLFFVLSGYLITSLLIVEARQRRRISIKQFYIRRARRLLPALYTLLLTVGAIGAFWLPQQAARLRGDLLAALGYVTNWWLISQSSSYFQTGGDRPDLLTHLWSLAVEEQYYLIWPVVLIVFFRFRSPRWLILTVILSGVGASTIAAAVLYDPFADPSRVYYGTDTRALAPLVGAALALAAQPWRHRVRLPAANRLGLDLAGVAALVALIVVAATIRDTDPPLYGAGFLGIAALGAVLVGVAGHPGTLVGRVLGITPLRWLGERSYGIYLWHWPICGLTRPGVDIPLTGWANAILRVGLTLALAQLSYVLIERPIRRQGFLAPLRRPAPGPATDIPAQGTAPVRTPPGRHTTGVPVQRATPSRWEPAGQPDPAAGVPVPGVPVPGTPISGTPVSGIPVSGVPVSALPVPGARRLMRADSRRPDPLRPGAPRDGTRTIREGRVHRAGHRRTAQGPVVRTVVLALLAVIGATAVGLRLSSAAQTPVAGGPVDAGPAQSLGPLVAPPPTTEGGLVAPPPLPAHPTIAFFGDSQGMTLIINKPADIADYADVVDDTIEGCGVLLGKVQSRSGEKRNLTANCRNWQPVWADKAAKTKPDVAVIMIGAWDVFDLTVDTGGTLPFGTPAWDANFAGQLTRAIDTLRSAGTQVALALLPCYRPIKASAGFWPERGDDTRTQHVNDLLRAEVGRYRDGMVRTVDPPAQFCADPAIASSTSYRWDGVHYYKPGAALYFANLLPQLLPPG
jgi:peptidoglycan/LPS O-acetylase OafA/YrhL